MRSLYFLFYIMQVFQYKAEAFPEMARYGYVNCNSCHVSLTGGGVLTDYGREIAREKLALFKSSDENSKEAQFAYGALAETDIQKYLKAGGDARSVYYYENDSKHREAKTILMQADLETAFVKDRFTLDGTLGVEQPIPGKPVSFLSRRHYFGLMLNDEIGVRVGKFFPAYGIKTPDHVTLTRSPLSLGDNFESYNFEASFLNEQTSLFLTGFLGRFDERQAKQDRGFAAQGAYAFTEKLKLGLNTWYGERPTQSRILAGAFALFGVSDQLYLQSEVDFQFLKPNSLPTQKGMASTQKASYELTDGLWVFGIQEYGKFDFLSEQTQAETYGIGIQIFPRSHFEFNLSYEKLRTGGGKMDFTDYAWLMSHFYL